MAQGQLAISKAIAENSLSQDANSGSRLPFATLTMAELSFINTQEDTIRVRTGRYDRSFPTSAVNLGQQMGFEARESLAPQCDCDISVASLLRSASS